MDVSCGLGSVWWLSQLFNFLINMGKIWSRVAFLLLIRNFSLNFILDRKQGLLVTEVSGPEGGKKYLCDL